MNNFLLSLLHVFLDYIRSGESCCAAQQSVRHVVYRVDLNSGVYRFAAENSGVPALRGCADDCMDDCARGMAMGFDRGFYDDCVVEFKESIGSVRSDELW